MLKRFTCCAPLLLFGVALAFAGDTVSEEFHQTYPLAATGQVAVHNINGAIHVTAWDRNEVRVDAVKLGRDAEALKLAQIVVEASANAIDIRTKYPEDCHDCHGASVEYTLTVPRQAALDHINSVNGAVTIEGVTGSIKASTVNGNVEIQRASGDVDASTVNGRVGAAYERLSSGRVSLGTVNGAISLALPKEVSAHLKASTVHGGIHADFDLAVRSAGYGPGASVDSTLGGGGAEVKLHTVNGGINLSRK
ncbi:MAG: DUF4097 family beta strand repeat-containing protein [Bryobacteraceae bacterium]